MTGGKGGEGAARAKRPNPVTGKRPSLGLQAARKRAERFRAASAKRNKKR